MRRHPTTLGDATKAYAKDTTSSVRFLIDENEHMAKELQVAKKGGEYVKPSARAELRREILDEVSSLGIFMWKLYFIFVTMHKSVVHLNGWQQCYARRAHILSDLHIVFYHMQTWTMRCKGAQFHLSKMIKPRVVELKAHIWS